MPLISFDTPWKQKILVFWCFQGVSKEISGMKSVNHFLSNWLFNINLPHPPYPCTLSFTAISLVKSYAQSNENWINGGRLRSKKKKGYRILRIFVVLFYLRKTKINYKISLFHEREIRIRKLFFSFNFLALYSEHFQGQNSKDWICDLDKLCFFFFFLSMDSLTARLDWEIMLKGTCR